ncbi:MAG: phage holin family protein [Candidatus Paceibacterota bacterium]|jgi:uncharacterized membrane protein YvlD (DUF360 family)|nr:phage holin family protein [Candidatus Paceibacterota bacterium]MDD5555471.1 phage holin family protein [Candidatus Paceibacterota bacterium]
MRNFLSKVLSGIIGTALSLYFIKDITSDGSLSTILIVGTTIGLLFFFIRPILNAITFPLRIITLNLFSFVIIMFLVWVADCIFPSAMFEIHGLANLFWMSLIVLGAEMLFSINNN